MKRTLAEFHASFSEKEKRSLDENLCEKITALSEYKNARIILAYIPDKTEADCTPVILDALQKGKQVAVPKVDASSLETGENRMDFYFLDWKDCRVKPDNDKIASTDNDTTNDADNDTPNDTATDATNDADNDTPLSFPCTVLALADTGILDNQLETGAYGIREPKAGLKKFSWGVAGQKESDASPAEGVGENGEAIVDEGETSPFMLVPGVAFTQTGKRLGHGKGFYDIFIGKLHSSGIFPFLCGVSLPCQILADLPSSTHDILMDRVIF